MASNRFRSSARNISGSQQSQDNLTVVFEKRKRLLNMMKCPYATTSKFYWKWEDPTFVLKAHFLAVYDYVTDHPEVVPRKYRPQTKNDDGTTEHHFPWAFVTNRMFVPLMSHNDLENKKVSKHSQKKRKRNLKIKVIKRSKLKSMKNALKNWVKNRRGIAVNYVYNPLKRRLGGGGRKDDIPFDIQNAVHKEIISQKNLTKLAKKHFDKNTLSIHYSHHKQLITHIAGIAALLHIAGIVSCKTL